VVRLRDWPPLVSLRHWLRDELDQSYEALCVRTGKQRKKKSRRP
jgi:hypothetical protein